jgi:hypothetical protein
VVKLSINQINECHNIPANIIELGADFVQQLILLGGLSKLVEAFEMGIKDGTIVHSSERDFSLDTSAPLVNATFHLQKCQ